MNEYVVPEDKLKYIQEKIEQGFELESSDEYSDTFELVNPKRCSDYMMEKFHKFSEAFFDRCVEEGKDPKEEFIKTRFVIYKEDKFGDNVEFPELRSIGQVAQIIDLYQFDTEGVYFNPAKNYIEIKVEDGKGKWF